MSVTVIMVDHERSYLSTQRLKQDKHQPRQEIEEQKKDLCKEENAWARAYTSIDHSFYTRSRYSKPTHSEIDTMQPVVLSGEVS